MNPAVSAPPPPTSPTARLRWALADGLTIVRRNLGHLRHRPGELIAGLISPVILVVLFGYVFGSAIEVPGGGNYRDYLMPGLFGMTTIVSIGVSAVDVASDRTLPCSGCRACGPGRHVVQRASVGDMRAPRTAGRSPATAPMKRAAAKPPVQATVGTTMFQPLAVA